MQEEAHFISLFPPYDDDEEEEDNNDQYNDDGQSQLL